MDKLGLKFPSNFNYNVRLIVQFTVLPSTIKYLIRFASWEELSVEFLTPQSFPKVPSHFDFKVRNPVTLLRKTEVPWIFNGSGLKVKKIVVLQTVA